MKEPEQDEKDGYIRISKTQGRLVKEDFSILAVESPTVYDEMGDYLDLITQFNDFKKELSK